MSTIYKVMSKADGSVTLVKANNQAQALRHLARNSYAVVPAKSVEVADYMTAGVQIQDATAEQAEPASEQ